MPPVTRLTSPSNPRVKQVIRLREQRHRRRTGLFLAEGTREVTRAAAAGLRVVEVYQCPDLLAQTFSGCRAAARFDVTPAVFRKMAYVREPEGILVVVEQPHWSLDALPPVTDATLLLVAVGTEKPGNLGAMVRTAAAAGCQAVIAAGAPVDPFNPNAIRASTGAVFTTPTIQLSEPDAIAHLRRAGLHLFAATAPAPPSASGSPHPTPDTRHPPTPPIPHTAADLTGPIAIAIGPENTGLDQPWLDAADASTGGGRAGGRAGGASGAGGRITIPISASPVDSLNASAAAAIVLFEAVRQRSAKSAPPPRGRFICG